MKRIYIIVYLWLLGLILLSPNAQAQKKKQKEATDKTTGPGSIQIEKDLAKFEDFVIKAQKHGVSHLTITNNIPMSFWQFDTEGDPYPAWYIHQPNLLKIFPPAKLRPYINTIYAEKVAYIFKERCKILRRYGLKAHYFTTEPALLPEKFFTDYPELRGARVDHPNRSKVARFAPCVDHPEVLAMYHESMQLMMKNCPEIEIFTLFTSDSGSGMCWTNGLYSDRNGNANCEHRPMEDRVHGFLVTLQEAAREMESEIEINMTPIQPRQWMIATFDNPELVAGKLPKGITLAGYLNAEGEVFSRGRPAWSGDGFDPVAGLTNPVQTARELTRSYSSEDVQNSRLIVSYNDPESLDFNLDLYDFFERSRPDNQAEMMNVLRNYALELAGDDGADDLLEIWLALDLISNDLMVLNFGPILRFGPILARWINRPLVPFPEDLQPEEKDYYRPYLFQAKEEEQANNLIDIQAMRMFEGYGARLLVQRVYEMVMANLTKAEALAAGLMENESDPGKMIEWELLANRLAVLHSLVRTIDNVVAYQALLDLALSRNYKPEANPVLGTRSMWDRTEIMRIARNEIDNAVLLKKILESSDVPLLITAETPEEETIRMLGPEIVSQLKLKIDIMNAHWEDYKKLYTSPNF